MGFRAIVAMAAVGAFVGASHPATAEMMHGHGDGKGAHGSQRMETMGDRIFSGKVGPWTAEARLVDMKAQMEKSGVSGKALAKLPASHHLMLILSDPRTGKPASDVAGAAEITGPDKASSSRVTLIGMGEHIGADVNLPAPGRYTFRVSATGGGATGAADFPYELKK